MIEGTIHMAKQRTGRPPALCLLPVLTVMLSCVVAGDKRGLPLDQIKLPPGFAIGIYISYKR